MRYDAAIIGAGANGLAAAAALAGAGLKVVVLERNDRPGGRAQTREFHPGFRASPFCDGVAMPREIFHVLDLARRGAILVPPPSSLALWPDRCNEVLNWTGSPAWRRLFSSACEAAARIRRRAFEDASTAPIRSRLAAARDVAAWPEEDWSRRTLAELADEGFGRGDAATHMMSAALAGRPADPLASGSALPLLVAQPACLVMGGLRTFADALTNAATAAGAEIATGLEVGDIRRDSRSVSGVRLADGTEIEARTVISTLDLRRTFFSLFAWSDLPQPVVTRLSSWRQAGATARLLVALDAPPSLPGNFAAGPIHVSPDAEMLAKARDSWRAGILAARLPLALRIVSAGDPRLAPPGKATMTVTIGCVPSRLFDGSWTHDRRRALRAQVLQAIEEVMPGTSAKVLGAELIAPPDIEDALGLTGGDLDGGEIAPDQMFGWRGFAEYPGGRTPIAGLYLGGRASPAGPFGSCAGGIAAARAVIADLRAGLLK